MRQAITLLAALAVFGCGGPEPTEEGVARIQAEVRNANAPIAVFNTQLLAENEPNNASTSEAKGHAQIKVYGDGTMEFLVVINNKGGETFTRAHIHEGAAGTNGGIRFDILEPPEPSVSGHPVILRGEARARAGADIDAVLENPENFYVNVHSTAFPGGAIRGQLE